jgi:hypothetical protein
LVPTFVKVHAAKSYERLNQDSSGTPLNKRLFGPLDCFTIPGDFGFDSPPRVCFLSVSGAAGWKSLVLFTDLAWCFGPEKRHGIIVLPAPPFYEAPVGDVFAKTSENGALRLRGTSNGRTFQVEQQVVAGPDSAGYPLGYRGMDEHRAAGIRPHRPFRRLP